MSIQFTWGKNNNQVSIETIVLEVKNTVSRMEEVFKEFDVRIYDTYGKIINSRRKPSEEESDNEINFESQKIFMSLIKIGVPLDNAYPITIYVINNLLTQEKDGLYNNKKLSTHEIRKVVAYGILHCNLDNTPLKTVEEWGDKYVRRYGHDSKRTKIYYKNSTREDDLSYAFIRDKLLSDIVDEFGISKNIYGGKIQKSQIRTMSEDIIDFVNNCNLYRVRYDVLKNFVSEMALQPPHPWLVSDETAEQIRKYDIKAVEKHYLRIKEKIENKDYSEEYYIICEMLHHTSSSILAGYKEFLGCKDLDAFGNLLRITKLMRNNIQDLVIDYSIAELPSDLTYIGIDFNDFYLLLTRIQSQISDRNRPFKISESFLQDIIALHSIAVELYEKTNKQKMKSFLFSEWSTSELEENKQLIKFFFASIDYKHKIDYLKILDNCFWIEAGSDKNKKFLVVCLQNMDFDALSNYVGKMKVRRILESILYVVEDDEQYKTYENNISKINPQEIAVEVLYKKDLQRIYNSANKIKELHSILHEKVES